jgi:hypothetical protein
MESGLRLAASQLDNRVRWFGVTASSTAAPSGQDGSGSRIGDWKEAGECSGVLAEDEDHVQSARFVLGASDGRAVSGRARQNSQP